MKYLYTFLCFFLFLTFISCKEQSPEINLKWNKAYPEDTFERSYIGLKWALSYLGSPIASDTTIINNISYKDSIIHLNPLQLGFSENASKKLSEIHNTFKSSDAYKKNNHFDLGRYVSLLFGNSSYYYDVAEVPETLKKFKESYSFLNHKGYINNSSVSKVDRIISFTSINIQENHKQAFISVEVDSISQDTLEYETVEIMPNGQLKFGAYDVYGNLKLAASNNITRAGKPAKCLWCHEVNIQPLFRTQLNHSGYLSYNQLNDTLKYYNYQLQNYQDSLWVDKAIQNKKFHTELEILYISFMEPSIERISKEWDMPITEVKQKLSHLKAHQHEEFPFLGNLYHRKDIDLLAPNRVIEAPNSIRELY